MVERPQQVSSAQASRPAIEAYGGGGFRVAGLRMEGSILVSARGAWPWAVAGIAQASVASLRQLLEADPGLQILLLGCGASMQQVPAAFREELRGHGIRVEPMATGAACRTFNVLLAEDRRVAAALLAT